MLTGEEVMYEMARRCRMNLQKEIARQAMQAEEDKQERGEENEMSNEKRALTLAQKRELDLLRKCGGHCHVYCNRTLNIFRNLKKKGFVELTAGGGQLQSWTHVTLIEVVRLRGDELSENWSALMALSLTLVENNETQTFELDRNYVIRLVKEHASYVLVK